MSFIVQPTSGRDFEEIGKPVPYRLFGLTARNAEGKIIAMGGVAYLEDGQKMAFADLSDEARAHPLALHKAGMAVMRLVRQKGIKRLVATADMAASPAAERWLGRFGFKPQESHGMKIWVWSDHERA